MAAPEVTGSHAGSSSKLRARVIAALATTIVLLDVAALVVIGWQVTTGGPVTRWDRSVHAFVLRHHYELPDEIARTVARLATPIGVVVALLAVAAVISLLRARLQPLILAATAVVALSATVLPLKATLARLAPGGFLPDTGGAWPSGHTATATVTTGALALIFSGKLSRHPLAVAVPPLVVGSSMLYASYHWFSDVVAGWLLGGLLVGSLASINRLASPPPHKPAPANHGQDGPHSRGADGRNRPLPEGEGSSVAPAVSSTPSRMPGTP